MHKIIHLEGLDRTGKDTLKSSIIKYTEGKTLVLVRSFLSQIVYARIYNRKIDEYFFFRKMKSAYKHGELFVYLYCDDLILAKRIIDTNETDINQSDIIKHKNTFIDVIEEAARKLILFKCIDCTKLTPIELVKKIDTYDK